MRSRAAPIGIRVTVSAGSVDGVGLSCNGVTIWSASAFQPGSCAPVVIRIGALAGVNGSAALPSAGGDREVRVDSP